MTLQELFDDLNEEELITEKAANLYRRRWNSKFGKKGLWSYEHREKLGLTPDDRDYIVHHKDGNHENNHKRNLVALTRAEHAAQEKPALKHEKCKICGNKHFGRGYCAKHYYLYVTKKNKKKKVKKSIDKVQ